MSTPSDSYPPRDGRGGPPRPPAPGSRRQDPYQPGGYRPGSAADRPDYQPGYPYDDQSAPYQGYPHPAAYGDAYGTTYGDTYNGRPADPYADQRSGSWNGAPAAPPPSRSGSHARRPAQQPDPYAAPGPYEQYAGPGRDEAGRRGAPSREQPPYPARPSYAAPRREPAARALDEDDDEHPGGYRPRRRSAPAPTSRPRSGSKSGSGAGAGAGAGKGGGKTARSGGTGRSSAGKRIAAGLVVVMLVGVGVLLRGTISGLLGGSGAGSSPAAAAPSASPTPTVAPLAIGDCIDVTGGAAAAQVGDTRVECSDPKADYKILSVVADVSGNLADDSPKCYSVTGDDIEFETAGLDHQPALYCLSSTIDRHSARRAEKGDCIDSSSSGNASYLVACSDAAANYVVVARVSGSVDSSKCDIYPGATGSLTFPGSSEFLLCLKKK